MIFKRKPPFTLLDVNLFYYCLLWFLKPAFHVNCIITNTQSTSSNNEIEDTPDGYYAFIESSKVEPPQVKPPPYLRSGKPCAGITTRRYYNTIDKNTKRPLMNNLCGDLNKGFIPINPMSQNVFGTPYPFQLIKNKTLEFFSKILPILKADETIPKVTTMNTEHQYYLQHPQKMPDVSKRNKRSSNSSSMESFRKILSISEMYDNLVNISHRQSRKFCTNDKALLCFLYKLIKGQSFRSLVAQDRQDQSLEYRTNGDPSNALANDGGPPTPCPAKVEYVTPVFARNYQGVWRYVVQIPYEGYFTQTIEITKCTNTKCYYMEGGCLSSPRWVSLLVAEIFYPDSLAGLSNKRTQIYRSPVNSDEPPAVQDFQNYQQYLHKRAVPSSGQDVKGQNKRTHCDGLDEFGCFQVRLYYDWFLVPGGCKCWRPDYFSKYTGWNREAS